MKANLERYHAKRNFKKTSEPRGAAAVLKSKHLRFVVQRHAARHLHYDFRLELGGVFLSWAVAKGPSMDPSVKRLAVEVEDHPLEYGDFEGTIPAGEYGGGTVQIWDRGFWSAEGERPAAQALQAGDFKFILAGQRLAGSFVLVRIKRYRGRESDKNWLLIKHRTSTPPPRLPAATLEEDRSVASGRTLDEITQGIGRPPAPFMLARLETTAAAVWHSNRRDSHGAARKLERMPSFIAPQLCKLVERPPAQPGWVHEVKFDGYRVQVRVERHLTVIRTRSGLDWTKKFATLAAAVSVLGDCIIDAEVVALDRNMLPSFSALQAALSENRTDSLVLFAFDLLVEGRTDHRPAPLNERKARLAVLLAESISSDRVRYVEHFASNAQTVLESARKMNLEGIVSKRLAAPYLSGRSGNWTKAKCRAGQEVVLGGWTFGDGTVRSLLGGVNRDGHLSYVGRIGTGYGAAVARHLLPILTRHTRKKNPFGGATAPRGERNVRWLEPELVAEIEFAGWTDSGMIRQAAFKGLRADKSASDVVMELATAPPDAPALRAATAVSPADLPAVPAATPRPVQRRDTKPLAARVKAGGAAVMGVPIFKPDKVLWPAAGDIAAVTKLELAQYFQEIGDWMLPHLRGRPCSLLRAPDGITGQQFFQRHARPGMSQWLAEVIVRGDKDPYVQIDRIEALAAIAQSGTLEIHPWNCGVGAPDVAGRLVFDLDPAPDVAFAAVISAALEVRDRLRAVGLVSFCKTTGGKGLHVVTPLEDGKHAIRWPEAKNFAHIVCAQMAADSPGRYLDTMSKSQRKGRIFLDYLRNDRTATAVAVLSPRARNGATISMPLHWKEVRAGLDPGRFNVHTAPTLLRKSKPWTGYDAAARSLADAIAKVVGSDKAVASKRKKRK